MAKNLSIDTHEHDPATDQALYDLLKEAEAPPSKSKKCSSPDAQEPMDKEGQDPGESPGDDEESTVGVNPDQHPDPEDRPKGNIDAPWGEHDVPGGKQHGDAIHYSKTVVQQFREGREQLLDKLFDGKAASQGAEQQLMGKHLNHAASGEFESSAPMLKEKSKIQKTASPRTVLERVRGLTGRH